MPGWNDAIRGGYFTEEAADFLALDIPDPYSITHMDATWDGSMWEITVEHDDGTATYQHEDSELPDWWWEDLYWWADEIGAEWELNYEEA